MTALLANDHVQLAIPEGGEDSARAFFVDLIGMREVAKPDTLSPQGCWFAAGEVALHLGVDPDFTPATKAHPAIWMLCAHGWNRPVSPAATTSQWQATAVSSPPTHSETGWNSCRRSSGWRGPQPGASACDSALRPVPCPSRR